LDKILENGDVVNHSIQALENNTVYLSSPMDYDDVCDSEMNISYLDYERLRLIEYCKKCGLEINFNDIQTQEIGDILTKHLWDYWVNHKNLEEVFIRTPISEVEQLSNTLFILKIQDEYCHSNDFGIAVSKAIQYEYNVLIDKLKTAFRTACFCTTPYSQLMWGGTYGDCHRGFCIEYTVTPNDKQYEDVYNNLFPLIYCKSRQDVTPRIVAAQDKKIDENQLWDIYFHGALRKSIDWAYQNEWRLLLPLNNKNGDDYNVKFFPISKVFLGNRMPPEKRSQIIDICKQNGIPYIGVIRRPDVFEMQDCAIKCEDCPKYCAI